MPKFIIEREIAKKSRAVPVAVDGDLDLRGTLGMAIHTDCGPQP